jgi:hypothetical protein
MHQRRAPALCALRLRLPKPRSSCFGLFGAVDEEDRCRTARRSLRAPRSSTSQRAQSVSRCGLLASVKARCKLRRRGQRRAAPCRCRTGRVRPVRVALARSGQQNQGMSLSTGHCSSCPVPAVRAGTWATSGCHRAAPNWALEPTRSGRRRKPGPRYLRHLRSPGLRHLPPRVGSALR